MASHRPVSTALARRGGIEARRSIDPARREELSSLIVGLLLGLPEMRRPGSIGLYRALPDEVDLRRSETPLRSAGWRLFLPRIEVGAEAPRPEPVDDEKEPPGMCFLEWSAGARLRTNRFGIEEPRGRSGGPVAPEVVVVPCTAVDLRGTRVGFGAGYYDRYLATAPGALRVAVAFSDQVFERIERRPWDQPMDLLVTETGVDRFGSRRRGR